MKWSSICATRSSGTWLRTLPATERPMRSDSTSLSVDGLMLRLKSIVSRRSSTDFQKKKRCDTAWRFSANFWNCA